MRFRERADDLQNRPFHTAVLEVLNANRALAAASAFLDPDGPWFVGVVLSCFDQFAKNTGESPLGMDVQVGWLVAIRSSCLSPRSAMLDGQYDVSGVSSSAQQLTGEHFSFASAAACCLLGFSFMSAQELSGRTAMAVCWHLAGMSAGEPN